MNQCGICVDGQLLAENTTEALRIVRSGDWVYKYLKPLDSFPLETAASRLRQIHLRVRESLLHEELNPLAYDAAENCLISRYVPGPIASTKAADQLLRRLIASGRGYLIDISPFNVVICDCVATIVDFAIDVTHPNWRWPSEYRSNLECFRCR